MKTVPIIDFGPHRGPAVCVVGSRFPVRMKKGTPDQRQLSMSSRSAAYVSVVESAATPSMDV